MMTDLKQELTSGQTSPLAPSFEKAGAIQRTATVKPLGAGGGMTMDGAGHHVLHMGMPSMTKS
jgi:hypothetical protein